MLTDERIAEIKNGAEKFAPLHRSAAIPFARAIEAEVRKQDEALIRQMLEAMQALNKLALTGEPVLWTAEFDRARAAVDAARLRLEGKP